MKVSRRALAVGATIAAGAGLAGVSRRRRALPPPFVRFETSQGKRLVVSNALPDHPCGDYPNAHDPVSMRPQRIRLELPLEPVPIDDPVPLQMWFFGIARNGVPFDPSGPFWRRDGRSGWQFEVLHPKATVAFGIDANRAHTQGRGLYHYHGLPTGLLWNLKSAAPDAPMILVGYAADGFPIYGPECPGDPENPRSPVRRLRSGYRVRRGQRPSGPGGRFDGTFVEDFEYVAGLGDLDECNGRFGPTPEFPDGTYHYILTDEFPQVPRAFRGKPDISFRHGPPPGVSPPVPSELMRYEGRA